MNKQRAEKLPRIDWLLTQLMLSNALVVLTLSFCSFQHILKAVTWLADRTHTRTRTQESEAAFAAKALERLRRIKRRGPVRGRCLSRSLALYGVLRRHGIPSTIQIGVRRDQGDFAAHAWVEVNARPVNAGRGVRDRHAVFERAFGANLEPNQLGQQH